MELRPTQILDFFIRKRSIRDSDYKRNRNIIRFFLKEQPIYTWNELDPTLQLILKEWADACPDYQFTSK